MRAACARVPARGSRPRTPNCQQHTTLTHSDIFRARGRAHQIYLIFPSPPPAPRQRTVIRLKSNRAR